MILDLHGYIELEALLALDAFLLGFEESHETECTIITGQGIVLNPLVIDELEQRGFDWKYEDNNQGAIIASK